MNELMHEAINKLNNINIMCGAFALELESEKSTAANLNSLKEVIEELLKETAENFKQLRRLLSEIDAASGMGRESDKEEGSPFRDMDSVLDAMEEKIEQLGGPAEAVCIDSHKGRIAKILHEIEEKAIAAAFLLKDIRKELMKTGRYRTGPV